MNYQQQAKEMVGKCAVFLCGGYEDHPAVAEDTESILKFIPLAELLEARDRLSALEPGTVEKITDGLWKFAEQECGHNGASAKHALTSIINFVHRLQKQNAALLEVAKAAENHLYKTNDKGHALATLLDNLKQQGIDE